MKQQDLFDDEIVEQDGGITLYPNVDLKKLMPKESPKPMEVKEGSITFDEKKD